MANLINGFSSDGVITVNRVVLKPEYSVSDLEERVATLCENVKTYHSDTGFVGGFVALNSGMISNEGSTIGQAVQSSLKDKEALIVTFWQSLEQHEASHLCSTFQPLFQKALEICQNGNEESPTKCYGQGWHIPVNMRQQRALLKKSSRRLNMKKNRR